MNGKGGGKKFSRRDLLAGIGVGAAVFSIVPRHVLAGSGKTAPSDKINVAGIGCGGRGGVDIGAMEKENIVAMCDVSEKRAAGMFKRHPDVPKFKDFRKMFDKMDKDIEAVTVGVPDHNHAVIAMEAIKRGKHVYCEKPLAHSVYEVRQLVKAAKEHNVVTQLGNQGHSTNETRMLVEWVRAGLIGDVKLVNCQCGAFSGSNLYSRLGDLPKLSDRPAVPDYLDWDQWIGPAAMTPYEPFYAPWNWRGWSPFGTGCIGDWVCHVLDPSFWALELDAPTSVLAEVKDYDPKKDYLTFPKGTKITYEFPAKGKRGPVTVCWYDGTWKAPHPKALEPKRNIPSTGAALIGTKGGITHSSHGARGCRIFPETEMKALQPHLPKPYLKRVEEHHKEWLDAIRENRKADSDFSYGGPLTEVALVGVIAIRHAGKKLQWDSANMKFTNCPEASAMLTPQFRTGWSL